MIFHHCSSLEFVSEVMNLLDMGSPECIAAPLLCCLFISFPLLSLCPSAFGKAAYPRGIFRSLAEGCTNTPYHSEWHMPPRLWVWTGSVGTSVFLSGSFELVKVLRAFYSGSRENAGSWSEVLPGDCCSISGVRTTEVCVVEGVVCPSPTVVGVWAWTVSIPPRCFSLY